MTAAAAARPSPYVVGGAADERHGAPTAERLANLVQLERRLRRATRIEELGFVAVNEALALLPYRQAFLLGKLPRGRERFVTSGVAETTGDAPFVVWARALLRHLDAAERDAPFETTAADLPPALAAEWSDWLPARLLLVPLRNQGLRIGMLAFARDGAPAAAADLRLTGLFGEALAHAWAGLARGGRLRQAQMAPRRRLAAAVLLALTGAAGFWPVRSAVLAPAEVIAEDPAFLRAPLDGVVDRLTVLPDQRVAEGEVLVVMDGRRLQSQLEAARRAAVALEAELRQVMQAGMYDPRARALVPAVQGRLDQQNAEVAFLEGQARRTELRAPRDGIAVFEDAHAWIGRPVVLGERILQVAEPSRVELEIRLSAADAIALAPDAELRFFAIVDPHHPLPGRLTFASQRALPGPDGIVAYRLKARFDEGTTPPRIGMRGTAKVYGPGMPLGWYLLRRPLAAARLALGA